MSSKSVDEFGTLVVFGQIDTTFYHRTQTTLGKNIKWAIKMGIMKMSPKKHSVVI